MVTIKTKYLGSLRTESVHVKSSTSLITDAPVDNNGKGESFSPTDLLATSLATCMITVMGISANQRGFELGEIDCEVTKIMAANPRRVLEIIINFNFLRGDFDENQRQILIDSAYSCPVALSIHPELKKTIRFGF